MNDFLKVYRGDGQRNLPRQPTGNGGGGVDGTAALRPLPDDERRRWTLGQLYADVYRPTRLDGARDSRTGDDYDQAVAWWVKLTGDPPLEAITREICQAFLCSLKRQPGRRRGADGEPEGMATRTVRKHGANVNRVLELAGPWSRANPDGLDILPRVPFCLLPAAPHEPPGGDYTLAELHALYRAAASMDAPTYTGDPTSWWRTLLVVGYFTGMRRGPLLRVRRGWIARRDELGGAWLAEPAAASKKGRGRRRFLHPVALQHIDQLGDADDVFAVRNVRSLCNVFGTLQRRAKVGEGRHFQRLRQTQLTQLAVLDVEGRGLERARDAAGHSTAAITAQHYVSLNAQEENQRRAILALPSPIPPSAPDARQRTLF